MSNTALTWALNQKTGSPTSKLVLLKLADQANDDGICWPSQRLMAKHCECNRATINRHIKRMAQAGLIEVQQRSQDGVSLPNVYKLLMHENAGVVADNHRGGCTQSQGVVAQNHRGGLTGSHKPSENPQREPSENQQAASDSESLLHDAEDPPVEHIPLKDGSEYGVPQSSLNEFRRAYPDVDIPQALAKMRVWSINNPAKRKKRRGIHSFINKWLEGDQHNIDLQKGANNATDSKSRKPGVSEAYFDDILSQC